MIDKDETRKVLIVEDESDIRNFASRVLELEGYCVIHAESGDKGLRLAKESRPVIILLDLRLPGLSGWEVLKQLKDEPELSSIPVIVFTASAAGLQRNHALDAGAADYLVKPLGASSLRKTVSRILSQEEKR